jgi:hypothetical protein
VALDLDHFLDERVQAAGSSVAALVLGLLVLLRAVIACPCQHLVLGEALLQGLRSVVAGAVAAVSLPAACHLVDGYQVVPQYPQNSPQVALVYSVHIEERRSRKARPACLRRSI